VFDKEHGAAKNDRISTKAQSMKADQSKASRETQVFLEFIEKSGLPIERDSVENRPSPEPDILCMHKEEGFIAFELVELCNEEIAETIAKAIRSGNTELMWIADPTHRTICKKLKKKYQTKHPIELLCYTAARLVTTDNEIIQKAQDIIESRGLGMFRRMWLLGERSVWSGRFQNDGSFDFRMTGRFAC
jgi:hypothetical protein